MARRLTDDEEWVGALQAACVLALQYGHTRMIPRLAKAAKGLVKERRT